MKNLLLLLFTLISISSFGQTCKIIATLQPTELIVVYDTVPGAINYELYVCFLPDTNTTYKIAGCDISSWQDGGSRGLWRIVYGQPAKSIPGCGCYGVINRGDSCLFKYYAKGAVAETLCYDRFIEKISGTGTLTTTGTYTPPRHKPKGKTK